VGRPEREGTSVVYALSTTDVADLLAVGRRILGAVLTDRDGLLGQLKGLLGQLKAEGRDR
jgi:hypothetical protein